MLPQSENRRFSVMAEITALQKQSQMPKPKIQTKYDQSHNSTSSKEFEFNLKFEL